MFSNSYHSFISPPAPTPFTDRCEFAKYDLTTNNMAAADIQLLVNTVFYIAIFVSGFVISIPVGVVNVR